MNDPEIRRYIKQEIARALTVLLPAETGTTDSTAQVEDVDSMFAGLPTLPLRPVVHPYGLVSRAPKGTASIVGKLGDHPGNRFVLGHRDKARPTVAEEGEVKLYNQQGEIVYLKKDGTVLISSKIQLGSEAADEPLVLGNVLKDLLVDILTTLKTQADQLSSLATDISTHQHPTAAPGPPSPPITAPAFVAASLNFTQDGSDFDGFKASPVEDDGILSDKAFTEKGEE